MLKFCELWQNSWFTLTNFRRRRRWEFREVWILRWRWHWYGWRELHRSPSRGSRAQRTASPKVQWLPWKSEEGIPEEAKERKVTQGSKATITWLVEPASQMALSFGNIKYLFSSLHVDIHSLIYLLICRNLRSWLLPNRRGSIQNK